MLSHEGGAMAHQLRMGMPIFAALTATAAGAWGVDLPPGTYLASCRNAAVSTSASGASPAGKLLLLTAECQSTTGQWLATQLAGFDRCVRDIANFNGSLHCSMGASPPEGTYLRSCRYVYVGSPTGTAGQDAGAQTGAVGQNAGAPTGAGGQTAATTLNAECEARNGAWRATSLADFQLCKTSVSNQDGILRCSKGTIPPDGSYADTCRDIFTDGTTLNAACEDPSGAWHPASLEFSGCRGGIANVYGSLSCVKGSAAPPEGSYRKTCIDIVSDAGSLRATCRKQDGTWVPSPELRGCTHAVSNQDGTLTCGP
jgi:hypothetical protein